LLTEAYAEKQRAYAAEVAEEQVAGGIRSVIYAPRAYNKVAFGAVEWRVATTGTVGIC